MATPEPVSSTSLEDEQEKPPRPQRHQTSFLCSFRYMGRNHPCHLTDISQKGFFVESATLPQVGSEIVVTPSFLESQNGSQFQIKGLVKHKGRYLAADRNLTGFGIEIQKADRHALAQLKALVKRSPGPAESKFGMF